jgi:DNA primase
LIAEASLDEVRDRTDIVEVVREYVPNLKQSGRNFKACCPFHQERTPSFMVNTEKQIFHCFGCHVGGDVFGFVMKLEAMTFPEAVEKLAERVGIHVAPTKENVSPQAKERMKLREVLDTAADYYHAVLEKCEDDSPAKVYIAKRGLTPEMVKAFRLGFAPSRGLLLEAAKKKGHGEAVLEKAGLVANRQGRGFCDYFFNRVLFPIENGKGEVVGFGARTMGDGEPKYLNSPETPVFSKGRVLYGLKAALPALRKKREALLLEGYMDVIAAHQFGITNACAPLGTALTEDHAALLKRYVDRATIVFDPDAAGLKAAMRGAEVMVAKGIPVRIATLPDGLDPDDFLRQKGVEAFEKALERAQDLPAFKTERLIAEWGGLKIAADKSRLATEILETIAKSPDEILRGEWIRALAQRLDIDEQSLHNRMRSGSARKQPIRPVAKVEAVPQGASPLPVTERDILFYLFRAPALAVDDELLSESDLTDQRARRIFMELRGVLGQSEGESGDWTGKLLEALGEEEGTLARRIILDERESSEPAEELGRIVSRLRKQRRLSEIEPLVLENDGDVDQEILSEYRRLLSDLKGTQKGE